MHGRVGPSLGPFGIRTTNSELQIWKSKAQRGDEAICPKSHKNHCQLEGRPVGFSDSQNLLEGKRVTLSTPAPHSPS